MRLYHLDPHLKGRYIGNCYNKRLYDLLLNSKYGHETHVVSYGSRVKVQVNIFGEEVYQKRVDKLLEELKKKITPRKPLQFSFHIYDGKINDPSQGSELVISEMSVIEKDLDNIRDHVSLKIGDKVIELSLEQNLCKKAIRLRNSGYSLKTKFLGEEHGSYHFEMPIKHVS